MSPIVKVLLLLVIVFAIVHCWPITLLPIALAGLAVLLLGAVAAGGIALLVTVGSALLSGVVAVVVTLAAVLSPIWIPVLLIVALISLSRRNARSAT